MPFRALISAVLFVVLAPTSAADDKPIELKFIRSDGATWEVEQTLDLASKSKGVTTFAGGAGTAQMLVKGHVTVKQKWKDEVTKFEDGRLVELKRTVRSSKIKAQKGGSRNTGLHKAVLIFKCAADGHEVRAAKGTPSDLSLALLTAGPIDPVEILLPTKPVEVGDEWEIGTLDVMRFQKQICIGVAAAKGSARNDISLLLKTLAGDSPASAAKIVKCKLVSVKGNVARVEFKDDKTHDEQLDKPRKGPLFDMPASTTKIEGVLEFDLKRGRAVKLTWKQVHDVGDFRPGPNVPGGNVTVPGFTETWSLAKTWK